MPLDYTAMKNGTKCSQTDVMKLTSRSAVTKMKQKKACARLMLLGGLFIQMMLLNWGYKKGIKEA